MCIQKVENLLYFLCFEYACSNKIKRKSPSRKWVNLCTLLNILCFHRSFQQQSYAFVHVHPGNGKSTLLSMLSVGFFYSNRVTRLCTCIQETENLLYILCFHICIYSNKITRLCMFIQETENLLYFLYFEYACSNKITHKCSSRKWKTHITFHSFRTSIQQENYT